MSAGLLLASGSPLDHVVQHPYKQTPADWAPTVHTLTWMSNQITTGSGRDVAHPRPRNIE